MDWIPVTERLPEEGDVVLAWTPTSRICNRFGVCLIHKNRDDPDWIMWDDGSGMYGDATHWMPLPDPPQDA